ncbi:hypothetical protein ERO13_D12G161600v2 [Gossypium hirsutum]|uniref:Uncharacterized protein n=3 Tax=Gossypium TaxID=3633 RepID=A0A5J5P3W2_GOSBA|nr:hypothetical protein ES319_D12G179700v1 [Gossypium barbadense]KAB1999712.1 hypothetical protein ES319_D12G179700v1 [Gossypium barbadense]KAG4116307.1 hypothetical protein ERO13_D12G161600v2 [Gossypium hirsutum]TYG41614.1 hypothetical protein ES288_D12G189700v1 [Gossypium darwinii]
MISPGHPQGLSHFMVVLITMITIIMLENKARATLLQFLLIVIISMAPTRAIDTIRRS